MVKLRRDELGAASMLVVIFIAILLTIITLGFIRLAINEQRVATDDDLTTRAYYAAESGVEDAKRALRAFTAGKLTQAELKTDECAPPDGYTGQLSSAGDYDIEYECQLIELTPATLEYDFEGPNETIQVPIKPIDTLGAPADFDTITVKWHINADQNDGGDGTVGGGNVVARPGGSTLPTVSEWGTNKWPAMLRVNLMRHPAAGNFTRGDIDQFLSFVNPTSAGSGSTAVGWLPLNANAVQDASCSMPVNADDYFCEMEFSAAPGSFTTSDQHYIRLTSLYRGTHVQISISDGGVTRLFDEVQAVVDVTGRAGGVYRRVQTTLDLISPNILPDSAITSLTDVCKDFSITDVVDDYSGIPGTSCTR